MTREEWLTKAIHLCTAHKFKKAGYTVPNVRVSVGLPHGRGSKKAIGQHWHPAASDDKVGSIFISPTISDTVEVLATLVHELVHASVGNEAKHGKTFRKCAEAVGLEGKMRATVPGEQLKEYFHEKLIKRLGTYPHSRLNLNDSPIKKQTTRMVKMECVPCDYKCRASLTKILDLGAVYCPGCMNQMEVELPEEE